MSRSIGRPLLHGDPMTKVRPPATIQDAVTRIAGRVTFPAAADAVGKSERAVRNWSDPDMDRLPSIKEAIILDALYLAEGGGEPPLLAVYQLLLERSVQAPADTVTLAKAAAAAARETGEAIAAAVQAVPATDAAARIVADREIGEAIEALSDLRNKLGAPANVSTLHGAA